MNPTCIVAESTGKEANRARPLDTISEIAPGEISQQYVPPSPGPDRVHIATENYEQVYLDVAGLKKFLETLEKCKDINTSFHSEHQSTHQSKSRKKARAPERKAKALQYLLLTSEHINRVKERRMQQDALKKAFALDVTETTANPYLAPDINI